MAEQQDFKKTITVEIKGLDELRAALSSYPKISKAFINDAIKRSLLEIESGSKQITPVDTGFLRGSHRRRRKNLYGEVGPTADYAIYVHEGTSKMAGRPFLERGAKAMQGRVDAHFRDALDGILKTIALSTVSKFNIQTAGIKIVDNKE